jgi:site-specific recombinase XerD
VVVASPEEETMHEAHLLSPPARTELTLSVTPIREALEDFLLSREAMRCTPATLEFYKYSAGAFVAWLELQGVTRPDEVKAAHVREWLAGMPAAKDTTLHARARGARAMLRFWLAEKYLPGAVTFAMPRLEKKRLPYLAPEQFRKVLKAAPTARDRAILLLLVDSGIRRAETLALNWGDVNFQTGAVLVRSGKGRKARISAIGTRARRALIVYRRHHQVGDADPLFTTAGGTRLSAMGLRSIFERLSRRSGVKITPHACRRTFAVQSLRSGMDVFSLQRLLGHSDVSVTAGYVAFVDGDILEVHARHGADEWL